MSEPTNTTTASAAGPDVPTCAYPGCERPARPGASEGRGSKPKYCGLRGETGEYAHTAMTAFRARAALDRKAAGGAASSTDLDRPVTMATARASELRTGMLADAERLVQKLTAAAEELRTAANPEAAEAQIEAVQADAATEVAAARGGLAREAQRRQTAEDEAEEARAAASEMDEQLQAAEAAREQAEQRAADARAEATRARDDAVRELEQLRTSTAAELDRLRTRAERAVAEARDQLATGRADAAREREELRELADSRAQVLEEARVDLRQRAERAEAEVGTLRRERDELRAALEARGEASAAEEPAAGTSARAGQGGQPRRGRRIPGKEESWQ
jgi:chromosome segregation ATPase